MQMKAGSVVVSHIGSGHPPLDRSMATSIRKRPPSSVVSSEAFTTGARQTAQSNEAPSDMHVSTSANPVRVPLRGPVPTL